MRRNQQPRATARATAAWRQRWQNDTMYGHRTYTTVGQGEREQRWGGLIIQLGEIRNVSLLADCFTCFCSLVCCSCFGFASGREIHRHLYVTQGVTERCLCDLGLLVVRRGHSAVVVVHRGSDTRSVAIAAQHSTGTSSTLRSRHPLD